MLFNKILTVYFSIDFLGLNDLCLPKMKKTSRNTGIEFTFLPQHF